MNICSYIHTFKLKSQYFLPIRLKNIELILKKILNQLMQKKVQKAEKISVLLIIVLVLALGCKSKTYSYDSSIKNEDTYFIELNDSSLNDSYSFYLYNNDEIFVSYSVKKGRIDLLITSKSGEKIYRGNSIEGESSFIINVKDDGLYNISVKANDAEGKIDIKRISKSSSEL